MTDLPSLQARVREATGAVPEHAVEAGCAVLYESVAEAFEPEWRNTVERVFIAMQAAHIAREGRE